MACNPRVDYHLNLAWNRYVCDLIRRGAYDDYFGLPGIAVAFLGLSDDEASAWESKTERR